MVKCENGELYKIFNKTTWERRRHILTSSLHDPRFMVSGVGAAIGVIVDFFIDMILIFDHFYKLKLEADADAHC